MAAPFALLENVTYTHWNQTEPTLRNVSLSFGRGTLTLLAGSGGSGKSTLASLSNGAIPHLLGGVLEGRVIALMARTFLKVTYATWRRMWATCSRIPRACSQPSMWRTKLPLVRKT